MAVEIRPVKRRCFLKLKAQNMQFSWWLDSDGEVWQMTMSRYLIRRIEETPNITVTFHILNDCRARWHRTTLGRVTWRNGQSGESIETEHCSSICNDGELIPNTTWLEGCVVLDAKGFIKTGFDLSRG